MTLKNHKEYVKEQITSNNPWYTNLQLVYEERENVKRIYKQRFLFFYKIIKKEIAKKDKVTLLDYGCGDGYWAAIFSEFPNCEVTGVDYNPVRLERARCLAKNAKFIEADLCQPNKQLREYDIVFCSQVVEHIENDFLFLANLKRYLKDDGVLILGTTNEGCFTQKFRNYRAKEKTDHKHFYKEKEIKDKIEKAGFFIKVFYREVFYPGFDSIYYGLTSTDLGFKLLELLTIIFPSQCSDYYFVCGLK